MKKVGFVTLYGRANAGKSTIINKLLGYKVQAVSDKPQTTRENIRAIYNDEDSQIIFLDTPGVFKPHGRLGSILLRDSKVAKEDAELLIYVVDSSLPINKDFERDINSIDVPVIIAFNKIDLITTPEHIKKRDEYKKLAPNAEFIELCCKDGFGLDTLLKAIKAHLSEGELIYPDDMISDRPESFIFSEIIREKCMRLLEKEVPHSIHIEMRDIQYHDDGIYVYADICVERESEKGIVIGKRGQMISKITKYSQDALHGFTGQNVYVELLVKVAKDWRNNPKFLKQHGYDDF